MKTFLSLFVALSLGIALSPDLSSAQAPNEDDIRFGEAAQTFAAGSIQKTTPKDGVVNLITGDNQTTGDRMILGKYDVLYLKLDNPNDVAVGDLFTVYQRIRKVFHPMTREYLGVVTIRIAVVKAIQVDHKLTTVSVVRSFGAIAPGDPVMRMTAPSPSEEASQASDATNVSGMIVELQADRTMTMVSQGDIVYLDRGRGDGLRPGDFMDVNRVTGGLPTRKIGQLKILSTEDRTATAKISRATTRIMRGDRFKFAVAGPPMTQPVHEPSVPEPLPTAPVKAEAPTLASSTFKAANASGQTRINLGGKSNFLQYDSGEAAIKAEGYALLDQLIEYLHSSGDGRLIRVEGHADNMEIGPMLRSRYPSNWELSKARASGVIRYLIEKGGIDSARLSSVGYGDSKPLLTNMNEEGRSKNRRVEVLLYTPAPGERDPVKPELPGNASQPSEAASLSARGGEAPAALPGAMDAAPSGNAFPPDQRPDPTPAASTTGTMSITDGPAPGGMGTDVPNQDKPNPVATPDK